MYQPEAYGMALLFMLTSMICWGSWANTMKLTPGWPFQLFYWDYVVGVVLGSLAWGLTLGSISGDGGAFLNNLSQADGRHILFGLAGGVVFNIANLLLVAAIEISGLAVAFPLGIGLALLVGALLNYVVDPKGNPWILFSGVLLVMVAIVVDARAYRLRERDARAVSARGIRLSIACGILMGSFYPLVTKAIVGPGGLGPYAVAFVFAIGVALCALPVNTLFMRRSLTGATPVDFGMYFRGKGSWHVWGVIGGMIWCTGMVFNLVASHAQIVGAAVSYAIGQGATMVSAVWGVFVWKEFAQAPREARKLIPWMFVCFILGLTIIAVTPVLSR